MTIEQTGEYQLPSTPKDRKAIKGAIQELVVQLTLKASCDEHMKAILERMKEELDVPPKVLKKLATVRFKEETKGNEFDRLSNEHESFETVYETLYLTDSDDEEETEE